MAPSASEPAGAAASAGPASPERRASSAAPPRAPPRNALRTPPYTARDTPSWTTRTGAAAGPSTPNGRPAIPSCISLMKLPPAASASPANSPIASMSVLRTTSPRNRSWFRCSLYPVVSELQHFVFVLLDASIARALRLARRKFLVPERIDMSALAQELGVNRVTLYRWVGSRDKLLVEVVWSLGERTLEKVDRGVRATGAERVVRVVTRFLDDVISNAGMRRWLADEGELAMRLLTRHA